MQVGIGYLHQGGIHLRWGEQPFILIKRFYILEDCQHTMQPGVSSPNLVFVLGLLVLQEQLQAFFADQGLKVAASAVALLGLITFKVTLVPLLVGLTNHLTFAMIPNDGHPGLQIPNMSNLFGEVGVRLTAHIKTSEIEIRRLA